MLDILVPAAIKGLSAGRRDSQMCTGMQLFKSHPLETSLLIYKQGEGKCIPHEDKCTEECQAFAL